MMGTREVRSTKKLVGRILMILLTGFLVSGVSAEMSPMPPRLTGEVVDQETGSPIDNAHVYLENSNEGTIVTDGGTFEFVNVPAGLYTLSISHVAYKSKRLSVDLKEGMPVYATVRLSRQVITNSPVVVSQKSSEHEYRVSSEEIKNSSWSDVGDVMKQIPSAHVYEDGGMGSRKTVSFHGAKPDQVMVFMDGVALNSGDGKPVDLAEIPLNNVQAIRVNPEASPGAAGGTINIITRSFSSAIGSNSNKTVSIEGQEPEAISLNGAFDSGSERNYKAIYLRHLVNEGNYDYKDENGDIKQRYNNKRERSSFSLKYKTSPVKLLSFGIHFFGEDYESGVPGPLYQAPTTEAELSEESLNGRFFIEKNGQKRVNRLTFSWVKRQRNYINPQYQFNPEINDWVYHTPQDIKDDNEVYQLFYHNDYLKEKTLNLGFESSIKRENYNSISKLGDGTSEGRLVGEVNRTWVYGTLKSDFRKNVKSLTNHLQLQLRYDTYQDEIKGLESKKESSQWSGKAGYIVAHDNSGLSWNISFANAYTPPSFVSRFLVESAYTFGNPNLKPEMVEELSSGIRFNRSIAKGNLTLSAKGFLRRTSDKIIWRRNWRGQYFPDNLEEAEGRGIDTYAEWYHHDGSFPLEKIGFNLTLQDIRNSTETSFYYDKIVPFQPSYLGSVYLMIKAFYEVRLNADYRFMGRRYTQESNLDIYTIAGDGLEPYEVLNLSINREWQLYKSTFIKALLGMDNVLDEDYELLDRMPMPGRTWRIKLELRS